MSIKSKSIFCRPTFTSTTNTAISIVFKTSNVLLILNSPKVPSSSIPGVSTITTGPIGKISIDFFTGSVVVPFILETKDILWLVIALTTLDFPAFLKPKNPMCVRFALIVLFKLDIIRT